MRKIISTLLIITLLMMASTPIIFAANLVESSQNSTISLGDFHSAAIKSDGSLWTWGYNGNGRLGDGTCVDKNTPVKIMDNVVSVSLGYWHSAAIKSDGSLWTWGYNWNGQLGDGTYEVRKTPVKIMDNVVSVSLGYSHSAAIKSDGSLWTWGYNENGQLGDGTYEGRKTPVKIMDNVVSVSLGYSHSAAIKSDGSLWTWGNNSNGRLGDGTYEDRNTPVKIMDNVVSVSLEENTGAIIKSDGSLWTWGWNYYGQLGDGTCEDRSAPVKIMDNVKSVSLGRLHSAAIKSDGSLWTWGDNKCGQLGNNTYEEKNTPIKIMDNAVLVSLGYAHSAIIKGDGSLWAWGDDLYGELGVESAYATINTPVKIMDDVMLSKTTTSIPTIEEPTITEQDETDIFPESMTIDYNSERAKLGLEYIGVNDPNATFEIEDKNVAVLGETLQVTNVLTGEYNDISRQILPKSPGKTVITAHLSDGTTKKCNLTVTGIRILLNDEELEFDQPPINQNGNLLVPIRKIAESMGKTVLWSDKANAAFVDNTNNALIIPIGETALYLGNEKPYSAWETVKTNVPSQVTNGRTLVPIRQFAEALGAEVDWIDRYSTATISYTDIESEAMSSSLFDAINLNYYIGNNGDNPFVWYTDNVVNPFYNSRNLDLDAGVMGISKPWTVITDLWKGIYGDTNSSIIIQESLHKVLENLPEDTSNDLAWPGLVKDIKSYCIDIEKDSFELSQEFTKEFLANHETLKYINDGLLKVSQSRGVEIGSYLFDFSIFTVEQVAYWLSDYTVNMTYIDILESALEKQGILDYNMREAIEDLRIEYTEKYIGTLYDLPSEFIEQGFNVVSGGASGLGKTVWQGIFSATGVSKKAEALKTFYSIYCYNHALDEELTDVMHLTAGDVDIAYVNALINLQKAAKSTAINSIADMANWWIKDEVNQSADELKTSLNSWSYHNW